MKRETCEKCVHYEKFVGDSCTLKLCMLEPYEEDEYLGIVTWLDVSDFNSCDCLGYMEGKH